MVGFSTTTRSVKEVKSVPFEIYRSPVDRLYSTQLYNPEKVFSVGFGGPNIFSGRDWMSR